MFYISCSIVSVADMLHNFLFLLRIRCIMCIVYHVLASVADMLHNFLYIYYVLASVEDILHYVLYFMF